MNVDKCKHHNLDIEYLYHSQEFSLLFNQVSSSTSHYVQGDHSSHFCCYALVFIFPEFHICQSYKKGLWYILSKLSFFSQKNAPRSIQVCTGNRDFLLPDSVPSCGYATICLSINVLMEIFINSRCGWLWVKLLWIVLIEICLFVFISLGYIPRSVIVELYAKCLIL